MPTKKGKKRIPRHSSELLRELDLIILPKKGCDGNAWNWFWEEWSEALAFYRGDRLRGWSLDSFHDSTRKHQVFDWLSQRPGEWQPSVNDLPWAIALWAGPAKESISEVWESITNFKAGKKPTG